MQLAKGHIVTKSSSASKWNQLFMLWFCGTEYFLLKSNKSYQQNAYQKLRMLNHEKINICLIFYSRYQYKCCEIYFGGELSPDRGRAKFGYTPTGYGV